MVAVGDVESGPVAHVDPPAEELRGARHRGRDQHAVAGNPHGIQRAASAPTTTGQINTGAGPAQFGRTPRHANSEPAIVDESEEERKLFSILGM